MIKKMYITPETKVSEFKAQLMCVSIGEGDADNTEVLAPSRRDDDENWGNLWN